MMSACISDIQWLTSRFSVGLGKSIYIAMGRSYDLPDGLTLIVLLGPEC
jgi:hypothetical protein